MRRPALICVLALMLAGCKVGTETWYEKSFYLLHEDHHTTDQFVVGREADRGETSRLVGLSKPDVIQIHAKGNPGWTTYPSKAGYKPPQLARDVLGIWRDVARQDGYRFSAYYNLGRDGEIMKRRPEWNRVKADGTPYDRMLCYHSGVAEGYLWPMVREIIAAYHPDGFWFDGSCFTVFPCYCDKCRERFRQEQGLEAPQTVKEPGWAAYQEMQRQIYREFIHQTIAVIHKRAPACLVAVNWAYSIRMPEKPDPGIACLTGDAARVEDLSAEAHWYDSQGLPFDLMTEICTLRGDAGSGTAAPGARMAPKPREQMEQELAIIIANGGRYFAWDNPTAESGLVAERFEYLGRVVAPFLRSRQEWCLGSRRVPSVSLLHCAAAHYAAADIAAASFARPDNRIDGATHALSRLYLDYEMIPDWRLARQDIRSSLLIVEHPKMLTDSTIGSLIAYVRNGGTLLITGMGGASDKQIQAMCGIAECRGPVASEHLVVKNDRGDTAFDHWLFRVKVSTAEPLMNATDSKGQVHPILMRSAFGRGQAIYAAIPLFSHQKENPLPDALLESVFDLVLPPDRRMVTTTAPGVDVTLRRKGSAYVLHLVNMAAGKRETRTVGQRKLVEITGIPTTPTCPVSVRLPVRPTGVLLQPSGAPLKQWVYEGGRLELEVPPFEIHQMVVLSDCLP